MICQSIELVKRMRVDMEHFAVSLFAVKIFSIKVSGPRVSLGSPRGSANGLVGVFFFYLC